MSEANALVPQHLILDGVTIQVVDIEKNSHVTNGVDVAIKFLISSETRSIEAIASSLNCYFDDRVVTLDGIGRIQKTAGGEIDYGGSGEAGRQQATVTVNFKRLTTPPSGLVDIGDRDSQSSLLEGR
jgi:hypothetical protein